MQIQKTALMTQYPIGWCKTVMLRVTNLSPTVLGSTKRCVAYYDFQGIFFSIFNKRNFPGNTTERRKRTETNLNSLMRALAFKENHFSHLFSN